MNEEVKKLYDVLIKKGYYTKSIDEFKNKWNDNSYRKKVYDVVRRDGLYTKDYNSFESKYSSGSVTPKKKEATASPSKQDQKLTSSATQPKTNLKPSVSSSSTSPKTDGKPDGLYQFPGNNKAVYKKQGGEWYVDPYGGRKFTKLYKGDVKSRVDLLEKKATKIYEESFDFKFEEKPKQTPIVDKKEEPKEKLKREMAQDIFEEEFFVTPKKNMSPTEQVDFVARERAIRELGKDASEDQLKVAEEKYKTSETLKMLKRKGYDVDVNGSLDDPKVKKALAEFNANETFRLNAEGKQNILDKNIDNIINSKLMGATEEYTVPLLNKNFGKYGFIFEETGVGDAMTVRYTTDNGLTYSDEFEIDLQSGDPNVQMNKLKSFMKGKYLNDYEKSALNDENLTTEQLIKTMASDPKKYGDYMLSEGEFETYMTRQYRDVAQYQKEINFKIDEFDKLKQQYQETGDENTLAKLKELDSSIKADQKKLIYRESELEQIGEKYRQSVGEYVSNKGEEGNFIGGLTSSFAKGVTSGSKALLYAGMDAVAPIFIEDIVNPIEYSKLKEEGLSDSEISDKVTSQVKRTIVKDINEGITNIGSLGTVSEEYFGSKDRNLVEKALFGLAESVGAGITGATNKTAQALSFFAMSYNAMQDEFSSEEFDSMSNLEKQMWSGVYGLVIGQLEKIGFNVASGQTKSPLFKKFASNVIMNAIKEAPEDAAIETIDQLIGTSVKNTLKATGIKVANGMISEGTTEGVQSLFETSMKGVINEIHDKKLFSYVPDLTTKEGVKYALETAAEEFAAGAIGGAVMGSYDSYTKRRKNKRTDEDFLKLYTVVNDNILFKSLKINEIEKYKNGDISLTELKDKISSINEIAARINKIPENLNVRSKRIAFDLINEKESLNKSIQGKDANLVKPQLDRIAEIDNQLKKIGEDAVKESANKEVTAEGGGVQYQGTQEGQPEVGQREGTVGETTQPETDLGNSPVEGRSEEEIDKLIEERIGKYSIQPDDLFADMSEADNNIIEKASKGESVDINALNGTIDYLYKKYKEITSLKKNKKERLNKSTTISVLNNIQQDIENDLDFLMTYKGEVEQGNNPITIEEFNNRPTSDRKVFMEESPLVEQETTDATQIEPTTQEQAVTETAPVEQPTMEAKSLDDEVNLLDNLLKKQNPNFQLDSEITQEEKKEKLVSEAMRQMTETDVNNMSEEAFDAEFPAPDVKTYPIEVKENSELANKLKRMGLKELIGKKINLVMADQLKVGEVMGRKRMGGPFFPLIDKLFGKVAWASMNEDAANKIINGAVKSDYTVVYNMSTTAIDSNVALTETFEDLTQSLPKNKQKEIFSAIQEQVLKNKYGKKTDQVRAIARSSKTLSDFFTELDKLDVDTISAVVKNIMPSRNVDAATRIGKLLQDEGITIETVREMNIEQFASNLPTGALLMVIEVTDKSGKKVTKETAKEALITPEQQDEEGLPKHNNYPIYVRGKAVALLNETVPFWNMLKGSINNINTKVAGIVREKSGRRLTSKEALSNEMRSASMTAMVAKTVSEKINTQYNRFVSAISKSFPNVEVVVSQEEFDALLNDLNTKKLSTKNAKVYGAVYKGKLYLNPSLENYNTPVHEFGHIWINTAKVASKELYNKGISLVKGSEYENNVRNNKEYQRVIKQMKADGASDIDIDNYIYEEALATAIGDKGESFVTASQRLDFKNWMRKLFSFVKSMTGISKYTSEQLEDITLDEFVQAVSVDIMSGTELFKGAKTNLSDALQLMTNGSNSIEYIMSVARDNGISDAAIKKYLSNQGFSEQQIKDAFKKQPKAPSTAKILGKPTPKKVTVNEATALKNQLKLEARAAREADMDLKRKQRSLVAYINGLKRQGLISVSQAVSIAKRIVMTNVNNPVMVSRMLDYAERVFKDAEYRNKLSKANSSRKRIKASIKNSSLQGTVVGVAKEFSSIDPRLIDDIDVYNSYADIVLDAVGRKSLPDTRTAMNFSAILDYTDGAKAEMNSRLNQEIKDIDDSIEKQMAETPDTELMTMSEIKDLIKSLKSTEEVDVSQAKKELIARYLSRFSELYNPIVEQEMKDQNTPQKQRELMSKLMDIDLQEVDLREAVKIIDAIQNFITNGITDNVESIVESYQGSKNAKEVASKNIPTSKARLKLITKVWQEKMMSLPLLAEWIFKTPKRAVYVLEKMGINDFVNGVSKATKQWTRTIDTYYSEFKNKKANGKNFMDAENIYERNMYADLKRTVAKDEKAQKEELDRKIKLLNKSVEVLRNMGDDTDKKKADLYEKLINKLGLNEEGVTIKSIESKVDKVNIDAVNWWINAWSGVYSELSDVSKNVYNTVLEKDLYYTPMKFSTLLSGVSEKVQQESERMGGGSFSAAMNYVYDKKSGSLMPSTKPADMETGRYVDLEFDMNNSRAFKAALVDINTAASTRRVKSFLKSKSFLEIIPDKTERDLFESRVAGYIVASRGNTTPTDERALGDIERSLRVWASLGATRALGGVTQPLKQTIPVLTNTLLNVGRNFSLISSKAEWKWIDEIGMPISNRGQESLAAFESAEKNLENNMMTSAYGKSMKFIENINSRWLKWMLSSPDVYAARSSFIAYYKQALRAKGKSAKIDFNNPANVDQEALNYAQHMIDKQQNVSDIEQMGTLFSGKSPVMKIVKNVLFPFMSFAINQKSRIVTDMRRFSAKGVSVQDRLGAAKSLFATSSEMVVFHTMSYLIGQYVVRSIASAFGGGEEDEEEDKKYRKRRLGYTISSAARDVLSPIPLTDPAVDMLADWFLSSAKIGASDADAKEALNAFNQMRELKGKEPYTGEKATEWLNKYIEDNRVSIKTFDDQMAGGMYSITISQFKDLYDSYRLAFEGEYDVKGFGDKPLTKYVDKETQEELKTLFYWNLGQKIVGFPSEGAAIIRRMESTLKKKGGLTENQKATEDELTKKLNKSKLNDFEMTLVKNIKATESQTSAERVSEELDFVKEYIKSPNSKQIEELIKVYEKNKAIMYDDVMRIKSMK